MREFLALMRSILTTYNIIYHLSVISACRYLSSNTTYYFLVTWLLFLNNAPHDLVYATFKSLTKGYWVLGLRKRHCKSKGIASQAHALNSGSTHASHLAVPDLSW